MTNRILHRVVPALTAALTIMTVSPVSPLAAADDATDPRWTALLGCWSPEAPDDGSAPAAGDIALPMTGAAAAPEHIICLLPSAGEGVTIATIANGRIVSEQNVTANGSRREVDEGGCSGFETAVWSQDGRRVFLHSDLLCTGGVKRVSNGVLALVSPASYVDVQAVTVDGAEASRTVRYVAVADASVPEVVRSRLATEPMAREASRMRAAAPLELEDVVEATRVIGSAAAEGLLAARRSGFELDAKSLVALADAGVAESTVDVMVALSYPDHFAVADELPAGVRGMTAGGGWDDRRAPVVSMNTCYDDFGYDRWDSRYSRCGYRSYYSPYGYDRYGWNYGRRPVVVVQPSNGGEREEKGAFVKGRGYTRKGAADGEARPRSTPAVTRSTDTAAGRAKAGAPAATTKPAVTAPAGSGTDTGRTAKPRSGGNQ